MCFLFAVSVSACSNANNYDKDDVPVSTNSNNSSVPVAKKLFVSNFGTVCNGAPIAETNEYKKTPGVHPIALFYKPDVDHAYTEKVALLPDAWERNSEKATEIELVACSNMISSAFVKPCVYTTEGKDYTLNINNASLEFTVYESKTGKVVGSKKVDATMTECPSVHYFSKETEEQYPNYDQMLLDFLKPFVELS